MNYPAAVLINFTRSKLTVLMHITIKRQAQASKDDHLILLTGDKSIPSGILSAREADFVKKEFAAKRKTVHINQLDRQVYVQQVSESKDPVHRQLESSRKAGALIASRIHSQKISNISVTGKNREHLLAFTEGLILSSYQFLKYRSAQSDEAYKLKSVSISGDINDHDVQMLRVIADATWRARTLVNEPQSFLTATELSRQFQKMGKEAGFRVEVWNKTKITAMKMGGLLAVNLGSPQPPTFTIMEHKPKNAVNKKPYVIVGKGVVYDTGGMSLKPTINSMDFMKSDMAGGAVTGAIIYALAKAEAPVHVIGLVPATDNRPDGNAYVPGDVITMMSGKTVEVLNTDAEGRLILADALFYAQRFKPEAVFEFSTLTGAAAAAVGQYGIVCMGNVDDEMRNALQNAGNDVYERLVEFPFWEEYDELLKSDIADIKNIGGAVGGAITAGRFLSNFTNYPFMHFDIAGPSFSKSNDSYRGKNGTGVGVRLMVQYFTKLSGSKKK
jgi:leucyl aminopeptidase